ncbi:MAG: invasin domain 3-containing protein, partial [Balneolaceae bacterium]
MKKIFGYIFVLGFLMIQNPVEVFGQTAGQIYKPATGEGKNILDPNGTGNVFNNGILFKPLPQLKSEIVNDTRTGAGGGHTDLVSYIGDGDLEDGSAFMYFDSEADNGNGALLFRVFIGGQSTASKGYSFLFNTDIDISSNSPKLDNLSSANPGDYAFEVVLETNNRVGIYELNENGIVGSPTELDLDGHFQKALAKPYDSDGQGAPSSESGYFYDFYVPISSINGKSTFDNNTLFCATVSTITRAQSGIDGTISDIMGINDSNYRNEDRGLVDLLEACSATTPSQINSGFDVKTSAPTMTGLIGVETTLINGVTTEDELTDINLEYSANGGSSYSSLTSSSFSFDSENLTWSVEISTGTLSEGDLVRATATATGKTESGPSSSKEVYGNNVCYVPAPLITGRNNGATTVSGTWSPVGGGNAEAARYRVDLYEQLNDEDAPEQWNLISLDPAPDQDNFVTTSNTWAFDIDATGNLNNQVFYARVVDTQENCTSAFSGASDDGAGSSVTPTINTDPIQASSDNIDVEVLNNDAANPSILYLYVNGQEVSNSGGTVAASGTTTLTISGGAPEGSYVTARAQASGTYALSDESDPVIVSAALDDPELDDADIPVIVGDYINGNDVVQGYSSEDAGATITIYENGTENVLGTGTVDAFGNWDVQLDTPLQTNDTFVATAKISGKNESAESDPVTVQAGETAAPTIEGGVVTEQTLDDFGGNISISGSGTFRIYIDGELLHTTTSTSVDTSTTANNATNNPNSKSIGQLLQPGVEVFATDQTAGNTESDPSNVVEVLPPDERFITLSSVSDDPANSGGGIEVTVAFLVLDQDFAPEPSITLNFNIDTGNGAISPQSSDTDGTGVASVTYTTSQSDDGTFVGIRAEDGETEPIAEPTVATFEIQEAPPAISNISLGNDGSDNISFSFDSDKQLGSTSGDIAITINGPNDGTGWPKLYNRTNFDETDNGGSYTYSLNVTQAYDDGDGTYTANVDDATDANNINGGNNGVGTGLTDTYSFSSDSEDPVVTITSPTNNDLVQSQNTITGTSTDNDKVDSVVLEIQRSSDDQYWNGTDWQAGQTTVSATATDDTFDSGDEDWNYDSSDINGDDTYTITATATDATGNTGTSSAVIYTIDTTAPAGYTVAWDTNPINTGNEGAADFIISSGEDGATYNWEISDGADIITGSGTLDGTSVSITGEDVSTLADGTLTVTVTLTDSAGNEGNEATDDATKDTSTPSISEVSLGNDGSDNITLTFNSDELLGTSSTDIAVTVTGPDVFSESFDWDDFDVSGSGPYTYTLNVEPDIAYGNDGTYTATINDAIDAAGNDGADGTQTDTYELDTTAPTGYTVAWETDPINADNEEATEFTISNGEDGADYSWEVTSSGGGTAVIGSDTFNETTSATISNVNVSGLGDGTLTVTVYLTDEAGNQGSNVTDDTTKDTSVPTVAASQSYNYDENQATGFEIGTVSASDAEGVTAYAITGGNDSNYFEIDNDGVLTLTATGAGSEANDFETGVNSFSLAITATDAAGNTSSAETVTINVDDVDEINPTVHNVTSAKADGAYTVGEEIDITIEFSESVTVTTTGGTPTLELETGTADRTATYVSGSESSTLTFRYTVQAGDESTDLDYTNTGALNLNDGTIRDDSDNDATLTLASPGDAGSLGANKNLVIDNDTPTLASSTPADDATGVAVDTSIELTFSESVSAGSGTIELYTTDGDELVESFDVETETGTDSGQVNFDGTTVTIHLTDDLEGVTYYYVQIAGTAIDDAAGNSYAGITNETDLNFQTAAGPATAITLSGPGSVTAGQESGDFTLTVVDAQDNETNVTGDTDFALSSDQGGSTFNPVSPVTITNGNSSVTFTYTNNTVGDGTHTITATTQASPTDTGLGEETASHDITVNSGTATKILVETANDGSGSVVGEQTISSGDEITAYAILRDASDNFIELATENVNWSLSSKTDGVADGDLVDNGGGSATFTGNLVGSAVINADSTGLTSTQSGTITVAPGDAIKLAIATQPAGGASGDELATQPIIEIQDAAGNKVTSDNTTEVEVAISPGTGGTLTGTKKITATGGEVEFTNLVLAGTVGENYVLTFSDATTGRDVGDLLTSANSDNVTVTVGAAAEMAVSTQPATTVAGQSIEGAPAVTVTDSESNPVSGIDVTVSINKTSFASGTLTQATDNNGIATFNDIVLDTADTDYQFTFNADAAGVDDVTSAAFEVIAAAANLLAIESGDDQNADANSELGDELTVKITDELGNAVSGETVSFAITSTPDDASGESLSGSSETTDENGLSSTTLTLGTKTGTYQVTATSGDLDAVVFSAAAYAGDAAKLTLTTQPETTAAGETLNEVIVQLLDANDNEVESVGTEITITLSGEVDLNGTAVLTTDAGGQASFDGLSIETAGTGYTLTASADDLTSDTSDEFDINPAAASALTSTITAAETSLTADGTSNTIITVQLKDAFWNNLPSGGDVVELSTTAGFLGTVNDEENGTYIATLTSSTNVETAIITGTVNEAAITDNEEVAFTSGALNNFLVEKTDGGDIENQTAGESFGIQITARDANKNTVTGFTGTVNLSLNKSDFESGGGETAAFENGVLSTHSLRIDDADTGYQITATNAGTGTESGTSNSFDVNAAVASKLAITLQPAGGTGSEDGTPAGFGNVELITQDAYGNPSAIGLDAEQLVTVSLDTDASENDDAVFGGTQTLNIQSGTAAYSDLTLNRDGSGYRLLFISESPVELDAVTSGPFDMTNVEDASGFDAALAIAGNKAAGEAFNLEITNGTGTDGNALSGEINVTVTSNQPDGEVFNGSITFTGGAAIVPDIELEKADDHTLTVNVTGVTSNENVNVTVDPTEANYFTLTSAESEWAAGETNAITITAFDVFDNTATGYTGDKEITLSGANNAPDGSSPVVTDKDDDSVDFGTSATIIFTNGEAIDIDVVLFAAETAQLVATDGTVSEDETLDITVGDAGVNNFLVQEDENGGQDIATQTAGSSFNLLLTARDVYQNTATGFSGTGEISQTNSSFAEGQSTTTGAFENGILGGFGVTLTQSTEEASVTVADYDDASKTGSSNNFKVTAAAAAKLAFDQQPTNTVAGEAITPAVSVQFLDEFNNEVAQADETITLSISEEATLNDETADTDENGLAEFTTLSVAEAGTGYNLTANSGELTSATSDTFNITSAEISAANSEVSANPETLAAGSSSEITVVLKDALGNAISGIADFDIDLGESAAVIDETIAESETTGIYTFTITNETAEAVKITVTADEEELEDTPVVTFQSGAVHADNSVVSATSPHTADGEDASTLTITLKDEFGNTISGLEDDIVLSGLSNAVAGTISEDDTTGIYSAEITNTTAEQITITATADEVELTSKPTINFQTDAVSASKSTVTADPAELVVASNSTLTITLRDANENHIDGLLAGDFAFGFGDTDASIVADSFEEASAGVYEIQVTNTKAEVVPVTVTANGVELDDNPLITFEVGSISASNSSVEATSPKTADGEDASVITITLKDAYENFISGISGEDFNLSYGDNAALSDFTEVGDGVYNYNLTNTVAETVAITATVDTEELDDQPQVIFNAGDADDLAIHSGNNQSVVVTEELDSPLVVKVTDANENAVSGATVNFAISSKPADATEEELTSLSATTDASGLASTVLTLGNKVGAYEVTATSGILDAVEFEATAGHATASAATSTISAADESITADSASTTTITVQLKDAYGNTVTSGGDDVELSTTAGTIGTVTDENDGTYTGTLTSTTNIETATITGTVNTSVITNSETVDFVSGELAKLAFTTQPENATAGSTLDNVVVQLLDANDNVVETADVDISVAISDGATLNGTKAVATDENGTATFSTLSVTEAGDNYTLTASVDGADPAITKISDAFDITVGAGIAANSGAVVPDGTAGESTNITITVRDAENNAVTGADEELAISVSDGPNTGATFTAINDEGDGTYTVSYTPTATGEDEITITLNSDGINGNPFTSTVSAGAPSAVVFTTSEQTITAGQNSSNITLELRDANNNTATAPEGGIVFDVSTDGSGEFRNAGDEDEITTLTIAENESEVSFRYYTETAGTDELTAADQDDEDGVGDASQQITIQAGAISVAETGSLLSGTELNRIANGVEEATITLQLRDAFGNNIEEQNVAVAFAATGGELSATNTTTNAAGQASTTLSSTTAGTFNITAKVDDSGNGTADADVTHGSPVEVIFTAGEINASDSEVSATSPHTADGDDASTVTITLKDVNNNNISSLAEGDFVLTYGENAELSEFTEVGNGVYTFELINTIAEEVAIVVTADGTELDEKPTVVFESDSISASNSSVTASPSELVVGNNSTVTITLRDSNNNLIGDVNEDSFSLNFGDNDAEVVNDSFEEISAGVYTIAVTNTTAESIQVEATVSGTALDQKPEIEFTNSGIFADNSSVTANPTSLAAGGISEVTVILADQFGNAVSGVTDFDISLSGDAEVEEAIIESETAGTYTFTVTNETAEEITVSLAANDIEIGDAEIEFTPAAADAANSTITATPETITANGENASVITITLYDEYGNLRATGGDNVFAETDRGTLGTLTDNENGNYTANLTGNTAGTATISGYLGTDDEGELIGTTEVVLEAGAAVKITVSPASQSITAGERVSFEITPFDENDNEVTIGELTVNLSGDSESGEFFAGEVGGSEITSIDIADENSSITVWYTDTNSSETT